MKQNSDVVPFPKKEVEEFENFMNWAINKEEKAEIFDRVLEWLKDSGYLNKKGKKFAYDFWNYYIKEE